MRILFVCIGDVHNDPRPRKELQHLRERGFKDVGVMALYTDRAENVVCWHDGFVDGCPLFRVNSRAASCVREAALALKPDVIHTHELDALWPLLSIWEDGEMQGVERLPVRLIYEAHEYERARMRGAKDRGETEDLCLPLVDELIVVSPAIAEAMGAKHVIPNSPVSRPRPKRAHQRNTVAFCGNVTTGRGLDVLAEAMRQLGERWRLVVLGDVRDLEVAAELERGNRVEYLGRLPYPYSHEEHSIIEALSVADVGVNLVDLSIDSYQMALPNKFFEYAFAGVPVVSNAQRDVVRLTNEYRLGAIAQVTGISEDVVVDASRLAAALRMAMDELPRTEDFVDAWCWENTGAKVLEDLYGAAA